MPSNPIFHEVHREDVDTAIGQSISGGVTAFFVVKDPQLVATAGGTKGIVVRTTVLIKKNVIGIYFYNKKEAAWKIVRKQLRRLGFQYLRKYEVGGAKFYNCWVAELLD